MSAPATGELTAQITPTDSPVTFRITLSEGTDHRLPTYLTRFYGNGVEAVKVVSDCELELSMTSRVPEDEYISRITTLLLHWHEEDCGYTDRIRPIVITSETLGEVNIIFTPDSSSTRIALGGVRRKLHMAHSQQDWERQRSLRLEEIDLASRLVYEYESAPLN